MTDSSSSQQNATRMPLLGHLLELRDRLLRMTLAVLILFAGIYPFANTLYAWLAGPLQKLLPEGQSMIATDVTAPFFVPLKLALVVSVFAAMPYVLYQIWRFVAPALYDHEKRLAFPLLSSAIVLFYAGAAFAYFVVVPLVFGFFTSVGPAGIEEMPDMSLYLDFILKLLFAFGLSFEIPVATVLLVLAGATTPDQLAAKRPYVVVGCFIVGMLLTPPDLISQSLLAVPMWLLFEAGVLCARMAAPSTERTQPE